MLYFGSFYWIFSVVVSATDEWLNLGISMATISASTLSLYHFASPSSITPSSTRSLAFPILTSFGSRKRLGIVRCSLAGAASSGQGQEAFDPDLRLVLELANDSELNELQNILFGPSYFSPLLKSITKTKVDTNARIDEDLEERENFIAALESRFLFLAADARSTLRGWRPSYRNVLLAVREKLNIPCSRKLSTEDLEAEIFLYLLQDQSSEESETFTDTWELSELPEDQGSLELGLRKWKGQAHAALELGLEEIQSMILKGGGIFAISKAYQLLTRRLSGKVFLEAANYQIKKEVLKKGGQLAAVNLESRAALLAAKQGLTGAAARYLGFRSMMTLLGPMLWGTFLADVVIQMLGTDYARILRAIYAFAKILQIRITRTYKLPSDT